ncbi:hydantoinase/oxoprolinase family protein [Mycetocola sp.]|uniref:hydantoinase/oxoprolinase family protein n=1 Tax=Mycetocola sp. TaxID=1871042 RepID=UPI0039891FB8
MTQPTWTVSIDAGGTFTDAIARSVDGRAIVAKVASTPDDPSRGLANAVTALIDQGMAADAVSLLCHGTTVATNATLTGNLARVALVTTQGFRDVMGYRQSNRPSVYSLTPERPNELVERHARIEVAERLTSKGEVLIELTDAEIDRVVARIVQLEPEAVAVSLLFSYLNDDHERRIGAALTQALPGTPVTLSSDVAREFREYPRTATTVINAALRPVVGGYLERAADAISGTALNAPFLVMQSNGGSVPAGRAEEHAHRLVLSGPAGGVSGLIALAADHGIDNVISLDMGGTSTDVCLVRGAIAPFTTSQIIQDHVLLAPTVDIHTIGAGGGSIAWADVTGRLRVGPMSAKASPGPACYGRGGVEPTITDAHVVLGTLGTGELAGKLVLDRDAAATAVDRVGKPLGMTTTEAADAILAIGLAHMVRAVRKVSVERGLDPREFTLVPFGGAGPLHAGLLLRHLGLKAVIVPRQPGLFSADGLLVAGLRNDDAQTVLSTFTSAGIPSLTEWFTQSADKAITQIIADGVEQSAITVSASVDCRYLGQGFELNIPIDGWDAAGLERVPELFHQAHEELYGHANRAEDVELVTVRIAVSGMFHRQPQTVAAVNGGPSADAAMVAKRSVWLPGNTAEVETAVFDRALLQFGNVFDGPAIVQQMDSTTVILDGQTATVAANGDLIVTEK